jgi:hypothetical protein
MISSGMIRWTWQVVPTGDKRNAYKMLVGNPVGKERLGGSRRTWEDNIKMDLERIGGAGIAQSV